MVHTIRGGTVIESTDAQHFCGVLDLVLFHPASMKYRYQCSQRSLQVLGTRIRHLVGDKFMAMFRMWMLVMAAHGDDFVSGHCARQTVVLQVASWVNAL